MLKDITVHLSGSDEDGPRLAHAAAIASAFDARLSALHLHELPQLIAAVDPVGAGYLQTMVGESQARSRLLHLELREQLRGLAVPHELRQLETYPHQTGEVLAAEVRTSDLFVGSLPYGTPERGGQVEEAVLFGSGRGCFFVPPTAPARDRYQTVFVAWKNTREAARSVAEAVPFLQRADRVAVGIVEEGGASEQFGVAAGADIARYLSRHAIAAELRIINGWTDIGEALLNEAAQAGAELIVMGGYGHSRFREWVLGGATRHILTNATVPVLSAH